MKKKLSFIIVTLIAIYIAYWFLVKNDEKRIQVFVSQVSKQSITNTFPVSGAMIFRRDLELQSEVTGKINEVLVKDGEKVYKGKILLRVDPEVSQAEVDRATANVQIEKINIERQQLEISNTEKKWVRKKKLFEKGLINKEEFDDSTNQLNTSKLNLKTSEGALLRVQAELNKAIDNLEKTIVRSPIDGVITNVAINVGETAYAGGETGKGSLLMKVADPSEVLAKVDIDERDISKVKIGQQADIKVVAFPGRKLTGVIESIATTAKTGESFQGGLNFQAKILLDKGDGVGNQFKGIRSGMTCRAEIKILDKTDVLTVPSKAVQYNLTLEQTIMSENISDEIAYVFTVKDDVIKKRSIKLGISDDRFQEVLSSLAIGEKVVTGPYNAFQNIKNGQSIVLVPNPEQLNIVKSNKTNSDLIK